MAGSTKKQKDVYGKAAKKVGDCKHKDNFSQTFLI
jgi:hypothetical protein